MKTLDHPLLTDENIQLEVAQALRQRGSQARLSERPLRHLLLSGARTRHRPVFELFWCGLLADYTNAAGCQAPSACRSVTSCPTW